MSKISSLLILYMLQDIFLIYLPTYINYISLLYLRILEHSLTRDITTQLHFRRGEIERKEGNQWSTSSKVRSARGTWAIIATASGLAKEAEDTSIEGSHGTCSNGRCGKNKYSNGDPSTESRVFLKELICYGCG